MKVPVDSGDLDFTTVDGLAIAKDDYRPGDFNRSYTNETRLRGLVHSQL